MDRDRPTHSVRRQSSRKKHLFFFLRWHRKKKISSNPHNYLHAPSNALLTTPPIRIPSFPHLSSVQASRTCGEDSDGSGASDFAPPHHLRTLDRMSPEMEIASPVVTVSGSGNDVEGTQACSPTEKSQLSSPLSVLQPVKRGRFLKLDCEGVAKLTHTQAWAGDVVGALRRYRTDLLNGVNPFAGAYPLRRDDQLSAAAISEHMMRKGSCADVDGMRVSMTDRAAAGVDRGDAGGATAAETSVGVAMAAETSASAAGENAEVTHAATSEPPEAAIFGANAEEPMGETITTNTGSEAPPRAPLAVIATTTEDPFLIAAAGAAAAHRGDLSTRSLMLGRRWYDQDQYPTPGGANKVAAVAPVVPECALNTPASGTEMEMRAEKSSINAGVQNLFVSNEPRGGDQPVPTTYFQRPPRLILYPDGTTKEVPLPGGALIPQPVHAAQHGMESLQRICSGSPTHQQPLPLGPSHLKIEPAPKLLHSHHQQQHPSPAIPATLDWATTASTAVAPALGAENVIPDPHPLHGLKRMHSIDIEDAERVSYGNPASQPQQQRMPVAQMLTAPVPVFSAQPQHHQHRQQFPGQHLQPPPLGQLLPQPPAGLHGHGGEHVGHQHHTQHYQHQHHNHQYQQLEQQQQSAMAAAHFEHYQAAAAHQAAQQQQHMAMQQPPFGWPFNLGDPAAAAAIMQGFSMLPHMPPLPPGMDPQQAAMAMAAVAAASNGGWPSPPMWCAPPLWMVPPHQQQQQQQQTPQQQQDQLQHHQFLHLQQQHAAAVATCGVTFAEEPSRSDGGSDGTSGGSDGSDARRKKKGSMVFSLDSNVDFTGDINGTNVGDMAAAQRHGGDGHGGHRLPLCMPGEDFMAPVAGGKSTSAKRGLMPVGLMPVVTKGKRSTASRGRAGGGGGARKVNKRPKESVNVATDDEQPTEMSDAADCLLTLFSMPSS